tara:strand:- start:1620 stop:1868 length:249 start_codon:yes stop_codon:yes gene_type:complete
MSDSITTEPIEIELLVSPDERRSSDLPEARRDHLPELVHTFDPIDHEVAGNPIVDRIPQRSTARKSGRLFRILDQLQAGGSK